MNWHVCPSFDDADGRVCMFMSFRGQHEAALEEMLLCLKIRVDLMGTENPLVYVI
jgi:hypothetical protein